MLACLTLCVLASYAQKSSRSYPSVRLNTLSKSSSDTVTLKAYVRDVYVCPPCPEGAQCKPCMENHLTVVEEKPIDPFKITQQVRIFTQHPDSLKIGRRYKFTVTFQNKSVSPGDNLVLVSYKPQNK